MVFAADYPFLDVMWTMLVFFGWVIWLWILVAILSDVFRRRDLSGWGKAGWTVLTIALPFVGVLAYVAFNGRDMAERREQEMRAAAGMRAAHDGSGRPTAGAAAEIADAKRLLDAGVIDEQEFGQIKRKALA